MGPLIFVVFTGFVAEFLATTFTTYHNITLVSTVGTENETHIGFKEGITTK